MHIRGFSCEADVHLSTLEIPGLPKLQKQRVTTSRDQGGNTIPAPTFSYSQVSKLDTYPVVGNPESSN